MIGWNKYEAKEQKQACSPTYEIVFYIIYKMNNLKSDLWDYWMPNINHSLLFLLTTL